MESVKELIEKRAYHLFLERGAVEGYHIQDWIQAEQEVMTKMEKKSASTVTTKKAAPKPKTAAVKSKAEPEKTTVAKPSAAPVTPKATVKKKAAGKKK